MGTPWVLITQVADIIARLPRPQGASNAATSALTAVASPQTLGIEEDGASLTGAGLGFGGLANDPTVIGGSPFPEEEGPLPQGPPPAMIGRSLQWSSVQVVRLERESEGKPEYLEEKKSDKKKAKTSESGGTRKAGASSSGPATSEEQVSRSRGGVPMAALDFVDTLTVLGPDEGEEKDHSPEEPKRTFDLDEKEWLQRVRNSQ